MKENNQATPLISTKLYSVFHLVVLIFPDGFGFSLPTFIGIIFEASGHMFS